MIIDFAKLQYQYQLYKNEIDANIQSVLDKSNYIMGEEVQKLESELKMVTNTEYAITCSSGTDALLLAMMAIDIQPGDEIITTPFSFIATSETIVLMKAVPVFVDVDESFNIDASKIEAAITSKTKVILPVSLYGQPPDLDAINTLAKKYNLKVILDGAQSFGSTYQHESEARHCDIYATSFFPAKPLGCYGDGGAAFTSNHEYAEKMKSMRVHGQNQRYHHKYVGIDGRLDTIQAAILLAKIPHYDEELRLRQTIAKKYSAGLSVKFSVPGINPNRTSVWAQYTVLVKNRNELQDKLKQKGVPTAVHYPKPLHHQQCFIDILPQGQSFPMAEQFSNEVMSLPMNPFMSDSEIEYVIEALNSSVS